MKKTGRNDPCVCGSGKKFKKCCENKMISGRFMATKVNQASSSQIQKTLGMSSLFHSRLAATPRKPESVEPVSVEVVQEEAVSQEALQEKLPEKETIC